MLCFLFSKEKYALNNKAQYVVQVARHYLTNPQLFFSRHLLPDVLPIPCVCYTNRYQFSRGLILIGKFMENISLFCSKK